MGSLGSSDALLHAQIPEKHRATVLTLYRIWMFLIIVLIINSTFFESHNAKSH